MPRSTDLAAASREPFLTLRRVERQQRVVEVLARRRGLPMSTADLARTVGASVRSVERDLARLRDCGLPLRSRSGPGGGVALPAGRAEATVSLSLPELAALVSSMAALGPTATESAGSAMDKLLAALVADTP